MRILLFVSIIIVHHHISAQTEIVFSHQMLNIPMTNPAFVGGEGGTMINFHVRNQWTGYSSSFDGSGGAPNSQVASVSIPVIGPVSGIGLTFVNDNLGPVNNIMVNSPIGYTISIGGGNLGVGLMPGIFSQTQKFDELRFVDVDDPLNGGSRQTQVKMNLAAGIRYQMRNSVFFGLSATNLLQPSFDFGLDSLGNELSTGINFISGYRGVIASGLKIYPTLNVRSDFNTITIDAGTLVYFSDRAYTGFSYRFREAAIFLLGYSILPDNSLHMGYSLDYVTNQNDAKQRTSQEILLRYYLPDFIIGGRKQVKTPRFTY